jgi:uncharacterized protein
MKYSQFNSIVLYDEHFVLFNTLSNGLIALDPTLKDLLEAARHEGIEKLENIHPTFYEALKENQFILEDEVDEVERVRQVREEVDYDKKIYHLTINPTMNCNFKCWYCYETHIKASRMNEEIIERINKFLSSKLNELSDINVFDLSWFGGEPLLYFYDIVLPIIKHFNSLLDKKEIRGNINFTSNGFLVNDKMVQYFKNNNVGALQITLDGHNEEHDQVRYVSETRGSYKQIISNVLNLIRNRIFVRLRINFTKVNIVNCHKIIEDISELIQEEREYLLIDFHRVWQDNEPADEDFISSQIDKFREAGFNVKSGLSMDNVRNSCYADKQNSAVINYNGEVFKCTARDFTTAKREGYIDENGEIIWENGNLEKRMNIKFKNKPCLSCRLLPICNGGCSQHALEYLGRGEEYCVFDFDENKKNEVIREKIMDLLELV